MAGYDACLQRFYLCLKYTHCIGVFINNMPVDFCTIYTPGINAEGYIVFVFPFVCSFVCLFVRTSFCRVEFASKFCVKVSQVVYISASIHQKAFIFGP